MGILSGLWDSLRDFFTGGPSYRVADPSGPFHRLYVGNLSYQVKEDELRALFSKHGRVKTLHLIRDRLTRRLKGYAFLEMAPDDARKALALNGVDFLGRKLIVSAAKSKGRQQEGGGQGQGQNQGQGRREGRRRGGANRWRKRRSGPRAYGGQKDDNQPLQRYE